MTAHTYTLRLKRIVKIHACKRQRGGYSGLGLSTSHDTRLQVASRILCYPYSLYYLRCPHPTPHAFVSCDYIDNQHCSAYAKLWRYPRGILRIASFYGLVIMSLTTNLHVCCAHIAQKAYLWRDGKRTTLKSAGLR